MHISDENILGYALLYPQSNFIILVKLLVTENPLYGMLQMSLMCITRVLDEDRRFDFCYFILNKVEKDSLLVNDSF